MHADENDLTNKEILGRVVKIIPQTNRTILEIESKWLRSDDSLYINLPYKDTNIICGSEVYLDIVY